MTNPGHERFTDINDEQIEQLLGGAASLSTNHATTMAMNCLKDYMYMESNSLEADFSNIFKSDLASILRKFYVCARRKTGDLYKRNSFNCFMFGIL